MYLLIIIKLNFETQKTWIIVEEDVSSSQHHLPINVNQLFFIIADFKYNSLEGYVAKEEMPEYLSNLFRAKRPL